MNVRELKDELGQCNKNATISSIFQEIHETTFYETKVIRTEIVEKDRVNILVLNINDKGITVKQLLSQIEQCDENLPVFVKEYTLKFPRRSFEILNVKKDESIVFLEIPQRLGNIY